LRDSGPAPPPPPPPPAAEKGGYSAAQAETGKTVYATHCARCHGAALKGGAAPALIGEPFARSLDVDHMTAPQLYDFITSHMPRNEPGFLSDAQYLAALAYLLSANGYPSGGTPLAKETLRSLALRPHPARAPGAK
jgi:polar amino acid transport system substrate-binding protein